jgi:NAD(P)-dependent dehydrogenase (short-subunit alcohol dehydrogenase family)
VSQPQSIRSAIAEVAKKHGRIDVLINNAGIFPEHNSKNMQENFISAFQTNSLGPYYLSEAVLPIMRLNRYGRIVNLSSGMGQLSEMESGYPAYRLSKTALNAVTRIFAAEGESSGIKVNSMCPGWVKTDMGGASAERSVEQGADTAIFLATLPDNGPTGGFFRDREPIDW